MYKKWTNFTEKRPYLSILLVAITASVIGIAIEYIINRDFIGGGFGVTLILVVGQFILAKKKQSKNKKVQ